MRRRKMIIFAIVMVVMTGCAALERPTEEEQTDPGPNQEVTDRSKEDKLAKTDEEAVEENINGFDIEDDVEITEEEASRITNISQQQKEALLENIGSKEMNTVLEQYESILPEGVNDAIEYLKYNLTFDYFLITAEEGVIVRENPVPDGEVVEEIESLHKVALLQRVEGDAIEDSNIWYRVAFESEGELKEGYVHSNTGTPRIFRFDSKQQAVGELLNELEQGELHFISNYKFENGVPPQNGDEALDEHGYRFYHSAPAYAEADLESDYRYIPDGMLVRVLEEVYEFYRVFSPTFGGEFYVPRQYIDLDNTLSQLNHVVVIDRNQQNQAAFEVTENGLNLISYTLSTTGIPGDFSFETTLGSYKAIQKRDRFQYLQSGTQDIAGYAPFAIRFTGGAYIHGVPVAYEEENGEKIDPGLIEYLHTIGTFPRSNMCVRNFTSHAEFLYNWMNIEDGAVIVIE
ncbi:L,D-transpeptidase family protein [Serpentinicella sp. ANB-PHB4]|uniref:L,D-transpeptidase family protein n=1 Tax=Serpentinicella sp. ANB-PHB4 TaxID=3074076 RepID=UPI00285A1CE0|nr:L,D-transpeptidase family protein [Serpentinicella sp. ANB-PHB4]MDR5658435.1 L,D-transpeptidase family protein [Serpentinicella sp. ANB-PHB4]